MGKLLENINLMYSLFGILTFAAFFSGGNIFVQNQWNNLIIISLGFLTFISVFFGFIYYPAREKNFEGDFEKTISDKKMNIISRIKKLLNEYSKKNFSEIQNLIIDLESLENLKKNTNPRKWLLISLVIWFLVILLSLCDKSFVVPFANISLLMITSIILHLSIFFTSCLITSIFIWLIDKK